MKFGLAVIGIFFDFRLNNKSPIFLSENSSIPLQKALKSLARWLIRSGRAHAPYVAHQGTAIGRAGQVRIIQDAAGTIWIGGGTVTCISGEVEI